MRPPTDSLHLAEWLCELVGTALLLLGGLSAVVWDFGAGSPMRVWVPDASLRLLVTGALFAGTGSLVAISPLGRRSGAHLNPAVSLAFWLTRHMDHHDLGGYVVAQLLGGLVGAGLVAAIWGQMARTVRVGATQPGRGIPDAAAAGLEMAMTTLLIVVIFWFVADPRRRKLTPLAVWVVVTVLVWTMAPLTGTSLNPARSFGPAVVVQAFATLWIYFVGPLTGAVVAAACAHVASAWIWPTTGKLFHDHRYPTVFRSPAPIRLRPSRPRRTSE